VRLQLHALAYNLGNFLRTLATLEPIKDWSLTSLKEKLIKIGAKVVSHGRYVAFQMAEVAIPRQMFQEILRLIAELRPKLPPAPARDDRWSCVQEHLTGGSRPDAEKKKTTPAQDRHPEAGLQPDCKRPATKGPTIPGSPEDRYHPPQVRGSSGESRLLCNQLSAWRQADAVHRIS